MGSEKLATDNKANRDNESTEVAWRSGFSACIFFASFLLTGLSGGTSGAGGSARKEALKEGGAEKREEMIDSAGEAALGREKTFIRAS